jgi:integrase
MTRNRRFQNGSLFKRGKKKMWVGRWREQVIRGDGKLTWLRRSEVLALVSEVPTKRDAERLLQDRLRALNSGEVSVQSAASFQEFVENSWKPNVFPTLKFSTKQHYTYTLNCHILPCFGRVPLRLISRDSIQRFLNAKLQSGLSVKTVKHLRTVLGTVLGAAETDGLVTGNPARRTRLPRGGQSKEIASIDPVEVRDLLDKLPNPSKPIAWLAVLTGLRIGELLALRWRDIDLVGKGLRVRQTVYEGRFDTPKTKRSNRGVPLCPKALKILLELSFGANPEALVFATERGTPLCRRNLLNRQLRPTAKSLGMVGVSWHWLRHVNATFLDATGAPTGTVQLLLGHSSPKTTRDHYIHSIAAETRLALEKVQDFVIGPNWTQIPA